MSDSKKKQAKNLAKQNVVESLKGLGTSVVEEAGGLAKDLSEDFIRELLGQKKQFKKASGEIAAGDSVNVSEAMNGKDEENKRLRAMISHERAMSEDERRVSQEKLNELRVHLQALISEVKKLAVSTENLASQAQVAVVTAPANPGIYHINFFEKVIEFLQSFRKKIDESATWLQGTNTRGQKKNYWSMYKKKGASFLLSPDHYLQRSAG